ncbi:MAG: tetratricopeptide repeat protein [Phormidium sp. PBR-2020]|nr:MAG: tetratricopeptide repeat protein [Phormidium sp. PBR-2020]
MANGGKLLSAMVVTALLLPTMEGVMAAGRQEIALLNQPAPGDLGLLPDLSATPVAEPRNLEPLPLVLKPSTILAQADSRINEAERLLEKGHQQLETSQFQAALQSYQQALYLYRELVTQPDLFQESRQGEGHALRWIGNVYLNSAQYEQAIDLYEQAFEIAREIDDRDGESRALNNLGIAYRTLGQYQRAINFYEQALVIFRELGGRAEEGIALGNLGVAYNSLGQYQRAINFHEQALVIFREIGDRAGEGAALGNLGSAYNNLSQYERAIDFYEQSLAIAREVGDSPEERLRQRAGEGAALGNLGVAYDSLGQYERAIGFYEQRLAIARELGDRAGEGAALNNLGNAYNNLGQYPRAIDFYEQYLMIARELGDRAGEGAALNNLGIAYDSLGQYPSAIDFLEQQLAITREIDNRAGEAYALGNLGNAFANLGQDDRALEQYGQAVALFNELGARTEEATVLSNIGILLNNQNQPELAIIFLKASVDVREAIRGDIRGLDTDLQQSFTDTVAGSYRLLADLLLQQDRIIEAQRVLDLLKIQELDDYLQGVRRNSRTESGVDYLRPELTILARYSDLQDSAIDAGRELASLRAIAIPERTAAQNQRIADLITLRNELNSDFNDFVRSPEIRNLIEQLSFEARDASVSLASLDRLRDELQQLNAVIFYPLVLEDRLELIITAPDAPPLRRTVPIGREQLNRTILAFRDALENVDPRIETPAQQLYDWLIAPIQADLEAAGVDTIIYAPDGQLRYIPLAALHDGDQWLAQRYQVNNITAESLTNFTEADAAQPSILAAAYTDSAPSHTPLVNGTAYTFYGLAGAREEVALLPSNQLLLDDDFSLATLLPIMDEFSVLHLATHAAFVPGVPEDSFILFGNGDTPTLRDIESWTLNGVDLVVLSACETGVGGLGNGEEILGLGYQFQQRGAKAVMASLWTVSDQGTQVLMTAFYDALQQDMTKTEALQAAQRALITNDFEAVGGQRGSIELISSTTGERLVPGGTLAHPYYWAPFILIGNGL